MDNSFLNEQITTTKNQIIAYQDAATALAAGNVQDYKLDTGQTTIFLTRLDLSGIQKTIDTLYARLSMLEARLTGCGTFTAVPGW